MVEKIKPEEENIISVSGAVSYLLDLIIQISKTLTKGRGLSKNGVNAFLLFLLTAGLIYTNTEMPTTYSARFKLYFVPLIFLIYFIVDLGKNIEKVNRFFKRLQQRTEFTYDNIMKGAISHEDLEFYLWTLPFSFDQIKNIIEKLVNSGQFTPYVQNNLLRNKEIYRVDILPFIKDSLINIDWAPSAVCVFLSEMSGNLPTEYLDKLIEKYGKHPSVLVAMGYFHRYKNGGQDVYFKLGYEFKYTKYLVMFLKYSIIALFALVVSLGIILILLPTSQQIYYTKYFFGLAVLSVITAFIFDYVREHHFIWSIKRYIKKFNSLKDNYVIEKIISDMDEAF